ncbi:hypothetical protein LIPSTDRAFT_70509 [Lipomyces starkeyi NRRL Y-11557]|uniref:WKF domain-containing protein n=1 Tax=Lipomyces starkeyi NRRL Y-11557 TaxID=675824 RepID=A0A1E3Q758_LIPST|nr:hypothetical protein LIPSTDRAFT_70509 [Lipomyces starkeyi NRRL Y-11557]
MASGTKDSTSKKRKRKSSDYKDNDYINVETKLISKSENGVPLTGTRTSSASSEKPVHKKLARNKTKAKLPVPVPEGQFTEVRAYLTLYATEQSAWKFSKQKQNWLLRHCYDTQRIPAEWEDELMLYIVGLPEGAAQDRVIEEAKKILSARDEEYQHDDSKSKRANRFLEALGAKLFTNEINSSDSASESSPSSDSDDASDSESVTSHTGESSAGSTTSLASTSSSDLSSLNSSTSSPSSVTSSSSSTASTTSLSTSSSSSYSSTSSS